ncbi:DUF4124 domain-containing protein [Pseudomonas sp. NFR16]|uniref:DUF4124 domain-containing protein n=1 Tax=Pseudomonas sp. NFR16 TaxID=1566248 RepID=UPI0008B6A49C|nr:DUF4124 domain-containing protein [Pseudomonas sp. NFR16]SEJ42390.1 protein of unknown function [Pseudomonas sp. NFR16]
MPFRISRLAFALLLFSPSMSMAATVNRCQDATGNITFTSASCPPGHTLELQEAHAPLTGTVPTAPETTFGTKPRPQRELVIVGTRDDGCGNVLSADQRRKAIINQQTPPGMTKRDVESLLGKPDKIIGRNAELRYVYEEKKGRSRHITFDESGCVKGKR